MSDPKSAPLTSSEKFAIGDMVQCWPAGRRAPRVLGRIIDVRDNEVRVDWENDCRGQWLKLPPRDWQRADSTDEATDSKSNGREQINPTARPLITYAEYWAILDGYNALQVQLRDLEQKLAMAKADNDAERRRANRASDAAGDLQAEVDELTHKIGRMMIDGELRKKKAIHGS